ncbi:MoxR family ATPase [Bradyrhizobium prioriisuperbiae]|uniref:AAA family ATPase n=1 Tax=Bradyrhizobium prioriisuperbiae TaxID=2854389 RepID=UPI0028EDE52B|nr:MoxR family ATPase [Bradyrhizobium prioritasuperba]
MTIFMELSSSPSDISSSQLLDNDDPSEKGRIYRFTPAIEAAVDVAIGLKRPLLVAGEPGCGKTELGYAVARRLGIGSLYFFSTKSSSEARELFYTYDAVGRFREAQLNATRTPEERAAAPQMTSGDFIHYQGLGRAILDAHPRDQVKDLLKGSGHAASPNQPRRSVVIIDEIDKAPRDFTNDLLREIEDMSFRVPELGNRAGERDATPPGDKIPTDRWPIVIATSNEESQMPDAFLRRCVFLAIEFPEPNVLKEILDLHFGSSGRDGPFPEVERGTLLTLFGTLRKSGMQKDPGIAELIDAGRIVAARPYEMTLAAWMPRLAPALIKLKSDLPVFKVALDALPAAPPRVAVMTT